MRALLEINLNLSLEEDDKFPQIMKTKGQNDILKMARSIILLNLRVDILVEVADDAIYTKPKALYISKSLWRNFS